MREQISRFGRFALDMNDLPNPLNPQPLPFETALWTLFTCIPNLALHLCRE
jgi:hypothetical protein